MPPRLSLCLAGLLLLGLVACRPAAPSDGRSDLPTDHGTYVVSWRPTPDPIPLSALFTIQTIVKDAATGQPVEDAAVKVDARMPAHGHGMQTRPEADPGTCNLAAPPVCTHPGGVYLTRGMNFHMPGEWTLTFDITRGGTVEHLEVQVRL